MTGYQDELLPPGFRAVPLQPEDRDATLALCLVVRPEQSPHFLLLRETIDASVYLGCLVDRAQDPKMWVEIWVQNADRVQSSFRARSEPLTNAFLDQKWSQRTSMFRMLGRTMLIETDRRDPAFFDPQSGTIVHPVEPVSKQRFLLCTDDKALLAAGLPAYNLSLHRYLWTGPEPKEPIFLAATADSPTPPGVKKLGDFFPSVSIFNPGGQWLARLLSPLSLSEFADVLGGKSWSGVHLNPNGGGNIPLGPAYSGLADIDHAIQEGAHLFTGRNGKAARLLEVLHLKLNLILQTIVETRNAIRLQQLPFLGLSTDSFRVRLSETGTGLPYFWTAHVDLIESSSAIPLELETSHARYFLPAESPSPSVFRPRTLSVPLQGRATIRIRKVLPPTPDGTCIEATIASDERLDIAASDLLHIQFTLVPHQINLFGRVDESQALATGETRFRTVPQELSEAQLQALEKAAGTSIRQVNFEVLPLLSSPCDMYSLAVIATRILLVNGENTLAIALDEVLSLARQISAEKEAPLFNQLQDVIERDPRWSESLGPHRLTADPEMRTRAAHIIPPELWWQALGLIVRLFPGVGPASFCRDFGDAPPHVLEKIFEEPIAELTRLQLRSRSLVLPDWNQNLEIHDAIYAVLAKKHS
jgi:hypothetical protein